MKVARIAKSSGCIIIVNKDLFVINNQPEHLLLLGSLLLYDVHEGCDTKEWVCIMVYYLLMVYILTCDVDGDPQNARYQGTCKKRDLPLGQQSRNFAQLLSVIYTGTVQSCMTVGQV
jgi:hypothetical protein